MKTNIFASISTTVVVQSDFSGRIIPAGAEGTIVECYEKPQEGYTVDLVLPNPNMVSGFDYENVILYPDQFVVLEKGNG